MTPEKINSIDKAKKTEPTEKDLKNLCDQYGGLDSKIHNLKEKLSILNTDNTNKDVEIVAKAIITIVNKLRENDEVVGPSRVGNPEREDGDTFNTDGKNVEINVNMNPWDRDLLKEAEVQKLGFNADDLADLLGENKSLIKRGYENRDLIDNLDLILKQINNLKQQKASISKKISEITASLRIKTAPTGDKKKFEEQEVRINTIMNNSARESVAGRYAIKK